MPSRRRTAGRPVLALLAALVVVLLLAAPAAPAVDAGVAAPAQGRGTPSAVGAPRVVPWLAQLDTPASGTSEPAPLSVDAAPFGPFDARLAERWPAPPPVTARAFLLADLRTGQVLARRDADLVLPSASTVKVLTAWTALRRADPAATVTVPAEAVGIEGATAGLQADQQLSVRQLLELVVARSANDAATALAIALAGSTDAFAAAMVADAAELGLEVTVDDVSGLSDATRLSARQLAVITRAAMADPALRAIAATRAVTQPDGQVVDTRNLLLLEDADATGVKTGFTDAAGGTLVATASRDGTELVAVVLGSQDVDARFADARALLAHGFDRFDRRAVDATWQLGARGDLALGVRADVHVPAEPGGAPQPRLSAVPASLDAAVATGVLVAPAGAVADDTDELAVVGVPGLVVATTGSPPGAPATIADWLVDRSQAALRATVSAGD